MSKPKYNKNDGRLVFPAVECTYSINSPSVKFIPTAQLLQLTKTHAIYIIQDNQAIKRLIVSILLLLLTAGYTTGEVPLQVISTTLRCVKTEFPLV